MLRLAINIGLLLVTSLAMNAHAANPAREIEPNGDKQIATPIVINDGSVRGQLSSVYDVDYYIFQSDGGVVRFLIGVDSDCSKGATASGMVATVVALDDTVITSRPITGCVSGTMTIVDSNTVAGTYYLKISSPPIPPLPNPPPPTPTTDDYVIAPFTRTAPLTLVGREAEPNNTANTATVIAVNGGEVRGQLSGDFDLDYYVFTSPGGTVRFIIGVDVDCTGGVVPTVESNIRASVRASDGTLITSRDVVGCTSGTTRAAVTTLEANTVAGASYYLLFQPKVSSTPIKNDYMIYPSGLSDPNPGCSLDLDGNGKVDALTDGVMLMRSFFGLSGSQITNGAIGAGATRTNWADIRVYLNTKCGAAFAQ